MDSILPASGRHAGLIIRMKRVFHWNTLLRPATTTADNDGRLWGGFIKTRSTPAGLPCCCSNNNNNKEREEKGTWRRPAKQRGHIT